MYIHVDAYSVCQAFKSLLENDRKTMNSIVLSLFLHDRNTNSLTKSFMYIGDIVDTTIVHSIQFSLAMEASLMFSLVIELVSILDLVKV
jgi:hypothetical protein